MAAGGRRWKRSARKLDDERASARETVVLPVRGRAVRPREPPEPDSGKARVPPRRRDARAPGAHELLRPTVLVVPDRRLRADAIDEAADDPRLPLRPRARARVLRVPALAERAPTRREVSIEVDAAPVLAVTAREAVGIDVRYEDEVGHADAGALADLADDRRPGALRPVDAPDDEDGRSRTLDVNAGNCAAEMRVAEEQAAGSHLVPQGRIVLVPGEGRRSSRRRHRVADPRPTAGHDDEDEREKRNGGDREQARRRSSRVRLGLAATALALTVAPGPTGPPTAEATCEAASRVSGIGRLVAEPIRWRRSRALGKPASGRLVAAVPLPREGRHFFTWDPIRKRTPNRAWRRWGTDRLVRVVLRVAAEFAADHPLAARIGVGDLSRRSGGDFGPRFGGIGHVSHENGLDADVYYPRRDGAERPPRRPREIDLRLGQDLVDLFVAFGAEHVFVGLRTPFTGPPEIVERLAHHDNHLHVRLPATPGAGERRRPRRSARAARVGEACARARCGAGRPSDVGALSSRALGSLALRGACARLSPAPAAPHRGGE